MDYDFSNLCFNQLESLGKKLESLNRNFVKEYVLGLNCINNAKEIENRNETLMSIDDILWDASNRANILYNEALKKVQVELKKHLKV